MTTPTTTRTGAAAAPTKVIRVGELEVGYREVGSGAPLVLLQRFRGTMDHWDPEFLDRLAEGRRVIVFDTRGVGGTGGTVPQSISAMADDAAAFAAALGLGATDWLGWSMGGMVAQALAIRHPSAVRRLVLTGTCPPGNPRFVPPADAWRDVAVKPTYDIADIVALFYTPSAASRAAAEASEKRMAARTDRVPEIPAEAWGAQAQAIFAYYADQEGLFPRLGEITAPVLIGAGDHDRAFPIENQVVLLESIPGAQLAVYADTGHGFQNQYLHEYQQLVQAFLA